MVITVTAENGMDKKEYTVKVMRMPKIEKELSADPDATEP